MKAYQTKYKDRHGKPKVCNEWHLTFNDRGGTRRRLKAYTHKNESVKLGLEIETVMNNNGKLKTDADKRWFTDLMPRIQSNLIEWNVVDGRNTTDHLTTPLSEHLKVFIETRRSNACNERYIANTDSSISRTLEGCGFKMFSDIDAPVVENFLARGRGDTGYSEGTYNGHLRAIKIFTKWLCDERQLTPDPLARIKLVKQVEIRKNRRPLSADEKSRLLSATRNGEHRGRMSAEARYLVYRIASECGLRYSEIKALKVLSFDFDANPCTVRIEAENTKGKQADYLPLNNITAAEIKSYLSGMNATEKAFDLPRSTRAAVMIRLDLKVAGIPHRNEAGQDIDFHSLRHTFITDLFLAGVPAVVVQRLARHQDLKTTMGYSHITYASEVDAIRKLRDLTVTGQNIKQPWTPVDTSGIEKVDFQAKTA